ncbi:MFS transporter [Aquabacterium sp. A08]|uniref:MFS transporter n=1 Tax=Aquabacterium sp. A08 TaxID=2718532 RepID=UPI003530479C
MTRPSPPPATPSAARPATDGAASPMGVREGWRYGLLGLPLAFVALPLYVHLPNVYAQQFGVPLATLGLVLLLARLFDAVTDPWLGRLSDRLFARSHRWVLGVGAGSALVLLAGMAALFFPPWGTARAAQVALGLFVGLLVTTAAYSQLAIAHQSWGARLGGNEVQRARIVAWREGAGLVGVVLASVLPSWLGWGGWVTAFGVALALGWLAWCRALPPHAPHALHTNTNTGNGCNTQTPGATASHAGWHGMLHPWRHAPFRRLMAVFVLSGLASAMPATLVLFFIQDRLAAPAQEPLFLATYFVGAAASLPLWMRVVGRLGLARTWLVGMGLSVAVFVWAATLSTGDVWGFWWVCALSGLALGTDLALPGALLAGVIGAQGDRGRREGAYFGWWNLAAKLNLALAAGLALPLLGWLGYQPGQAKAEGLFALTLAYAVLPCAIKLLAAASLYWHFVRPAAAGPAPSLAPQEAP